MNKIINRCYSAQSSLKRTALYALHQKYGGKMVPFAGWSLPVDYSDMSLRESHNHTRNKASLFDVSHMLQFKLYGKDRVKYLEELVVADVGAMPDNTGGLSLFTNEQGGIHDDTIINNAGDHLYVVSNAGCAEKIQPLVQNHVSTRKGELDVEVEFLQDKSLVAIQGPKAASILQEATTLDLSSMKFMNGIDGSLYGIDGLRITRCGYTGEDGFEISVPSENVENLVESYLASDADAKLAGLGARDTLRLEAGLCLYGNDIDETTTPVEGTLLWTIPKTRRARKDFPGASIILQQIKDKPKRKRIGLVSTGPPIRGGAAVYDEGDKQIGEVTSGGPSPSIGNNIAMAYVETKLSKAGTKLKFKRGKKDIECVVTKMPFRATNYV